MELGVFLCTSCKESRVSIQKCSHKFGTKTSSKIHNHSIKEVHARKHGNLIKNIIMPLTISLIDVITQQKSESEISCLTTSSLTFDLDPGKKKLEGEFAVKVKFWNEGKYCNLMLRTSLKITSTKLVNDVILQYAAYFPCLSFYNKIIRI